MTIPKREEKGMLSATKTHHAKGAYHDISSTTHDRGYAGEESLTPYPDLLRATAFPSGKRISAFEATAKELAGLVTTNFAAYEEGVSAQVKAAGPVA
jgi:hypothetical protein